MRALIFDTETTGLKPGNICQLSYIIDDNDRLTGVNYFFKVDYIEPGAQRIHGLNVSDLAELSRGLGFSDHSDRIANDFSGCPVWIAHNFKFDYSFLQAEYRRCSKRVGAQRQFCTMQYYAPIIKLPSSGSWSGARQYKYPNLAELTAFMRLSDGEITEFARKTFGVGEGGLNFHDARYDCSAVYLSYKKGLAAGYGPKD